MWQIVSKFASALSTFIILGFISRVYGEGGTGVFTLAFTYLGFFYLAVDLGLNAYFLPKINANDNEDAANCLFNARLMWSLVLIIFANLLALFLPFVDNNFRLLVLIGSITITTNSILSSCNLIFQYNLKYEYSLAGVTLGAIFNLIIITFLCLVRAPIPLLALGALFGSLISSLVAISLTANFHRFSINLSQTKFLVATVKNAWPMMVTLGLNTVYFRIDTFILTANYSMSIVGTYNLAYQIFQTALVIPTYIVNSFFPILVQNEKTNWNLFVKKIYTAGLILFGISVLGIILTWILAPFLIQIMTGGSFGGSAVALRILSLSFPAFFLTSLMMIIMIIRQEYKTLLYIYLAGLIVNLLLNLVWIPQFSFIAASWVTVISEYAILILQAVIVVPWLRQKGAQ